MSYSNITVVTAQGTFGYQPSDPFVPISYNTLDLIQDIPHNAQLEVERIFSIDRNGDTNAIPNFLNDTNVAVVDKQRVFIIPTDRITYNITTKQITDVLLPSSGVDVFNYTFTYISGPNVGQQGSIAVPQLRLGDNIIIRRKTVSNTPLVLWTAGSKLTTAQLNLNTTQLLFLAQELNNKITITSVSTEQILDNAITTPKILNGAVTSDKLFDLGGPKRLLGSGNVTANADGLYDVQEITLGNGFYWDENSTVLEVADIETGIKGDINIIVPRTNWRIIDNAVTYAKLQDVTASRLLGRGSSGNGDPQELTVANSLTISGTQLAVTTPLTDGNKGDVNVSGNGTAFTLTNNAVDTAQITDRAVTYGKIQNMSAIGNRVLGTVAGSEPPQEVQVNTNMLAAQAVTNEKLAFNSVGANNVQANAVVTAGIANNAVTYDKMRTVATANRVLGSTSSNGTVSEVQVVTDMLADNAVSFAKMQQVATNTLLGRAASGTGNVELIAITAAGRELIDENSVADMRQYLQLGTAALSSTAEFAPASHTHGNINALGQVGTTANLPLITGNNGIIQTGTFGTTAGTFCVGNDARLSDARTPVAHTHPISDVTNLQTSLDAKSNVGHGHVIGDVSGLQTALDGKAASSHTHTIAEVTDLQTALDGKAALSHTHAISEVTNLQTNLDNKSNVGHTHVIANVTGLQTALDGKAATSHTHTISDVTNLQPALDGKANITHTHLIADVTGLQTALDAKVDDSQISAFALTVLDDTTAAGMRTTLGLGTAATQNSTAFAAASHNHTLSNITDAGSAASKNVPAVGVDATTTQVVMGDDTRLTNSRTPVAHTHAISDVTGLQTALDNKLDDSQATTFGLSLLDDANAAAARTTLELGTAATQASTAFAAASHTHAISDVTNLETTLEGKAASSHTHSAADITSGTLGIARGGTGTTATPTSGQLLIGNNTGFTLATITAGTNIAISNTAGGITISQVGEPVAPSALLADGTYGDINISGNTWTVVNNAISTAKIANDAVTFDKIQNIATDRLLGRATAGNGNVEEITLTSAGRALLDDADAAAQRTTLGLGTAATQASTAFAAASHTHAISDVTGLQTALDAKVDDSQISTYALTLLDDANAGAARTTLGLGTVATLNVSTLGDASLSEVVTGSDSRLTNARTPVAHTHTIGNVTGLQDALDAKVDDSQISTFALTMLDDTDAASVRSTLGLGSAATQASNTFAAVSHSHIIGDVSNLQAALDAKANTTHTHAISDVVDLQTTLNNKSNTGHTHVISDVTNLQTELNNKAALSHNHAIANVTGLQDALDGKAATSHTHTIANVTNLQTELNNKLNSSAVSAYMLTVLDDANAAAAQSTLGLGSAATRADSYFALAGHTHGTTGLNDGAVTYAKMQNVATANRLLGSTTAGGPVSEVQVQTGMIADSAVTAAKLASNSVETAKITDLNVTTAKLANGAVTSDKIANGAVTYAKLPTIVTANRLLGSTTAGGVVAEVQITAGMLQDGLVTTAKIADANVTAAKLASGVAAANLGNLGVTTALLADNAVTTIKITDLNVTTSKLANNAVTYGKMQVVAGANRLLGSTTAGSAVSEVQVATDMVLDSAITTAKVNDAAITADKLGSNAVTTVKIADRNVTFPKLPASVTANRVLGATTAGANYSEVQVNTDMIADGAITAAKIASGAITFSASDLADGSITANKLATDSVTEVKIQNAAVTNAKISNRAGNSVMGRSASTAGSVADIAPTVSGQVLRYDGTTTGFGQVAETGIADGAITTAKIGDGQVTGAKILDGTIGAGKLASNAITWPKSVQNLITLSSDTTYTSPNESTSWNTVLLRKTNNNVYVSGLDISVTPTYTTSKIKIQYAPIALAQQRTPGTSNWGTASVGWYVIRTVGGVNTEIFTSSSNGTFTIDQLLAGIVDTPNTTSAVTYKLYAVNLVSTNQTRVVLTGPTARQVAHLTEMFA